ncbi:head-tail connector protein [Hyphomonas sp.]|uniref:head-tail connector protein n=1 Tax=Hyphomonas sp. TaxID=87 RepID=UPI0030015EC3
MISPPDGEALSLGAAKEYLRIGHAGEDGLVADLIASARARLEAETGLALIARSVKRRYDRWPSGVTRTGLRLVPGPASALVSVETADADGGTQLYTARFQLGGGRLRLKPFVALPPIPPGGHADVTFVTGYGAAADVPEDLVQALKRLVLAAYRREAGEALPDEVRDILAARRERRI